MPTTTQDDVFSLGVIAYQMLTGKLDTGPGTDADEELTDLGVPAELVKVVKACASDNPARRPTNAMALVERLAVLAPASNVHVRLDAGNTGSEPVSVELPAPALVERPVVFPLPLATEEEVIPLALATAALPTAERPPAVQPSAPVGDGDRCAVDRDSTKPSTRQAEASAAVALEGDRDAEPTSEIDQEYAEFIRARASTEQTTNWFAGRFWRLEHWHSAAKEGRVAAMVLYAEAQCLAAQTVGFMEAGRAECYAAALQWHSLATAHGNRVALSRRCWLLENGLGGQGRDLAAAFAGYTTLAEAGDMDAMCSLGMLHFQGWEGPPNYDEARTCFQIAADAGNARAMLRLAWLSRHGYGSKPDQETSLNWLHKAAAIGNPAMTSSTCRTSINVSHADNHHEVS